MVLSRKYERALIKKYAVFVKHLQPTEELLGYLRSKSVLTEELANQVKVNKL